MSFVVIIPARYASTRFPGKPLIDLGGKPMVVRVAEQACRSAATQVVVATDDERIAAACRTYGASVVMTSDQHPTGTDRLSEAASKLGLAPETIVVNVQGDEPLLPPQAINDVATLLADHPGAAISTACHAIHTREEWFNPNVVKVVMNARGEALYFSRAPIPFARDATAADPSRTGALPLGLVAYRHIGLYAYRVSFLARFPTLAQTPLETTESLEQLRAMHHGETIAVGVFEAPLPPGIDTPEDYEALRGRFAP
jgi:3-deoxy-manno-octulosonate cytidylyltransferase (CMP-KDO synthetase)